MSLDSMDYACSRPFDSSSVSRCRPHVLDQRGELLGEVLGLGLPFRLSASSRWNCEGLGYENLLTVDNASLADYVDTATDGPIFDIDLGFTHTCLLARSIHLSLCEA
eukprot:2927192-Amphidinium_carterae.1